MLELGRVGVPTYRIRVVIFFIENHHFVGFVEEISAIIKKFPRPWVAWVARFCMSEYFRQDFAGNSLIKSQLSATSISFFCTDISEEISRERQKWLSPSSSKSIF